MVGQVLKNIPGVVLGERQPYLHEKTVDIFKQELTIFGPQFHEKDFLIESIQDITDESFESRYYKLTDIKSLRGEVVLHCAEGEILELRVIHQEVLSE